MHFPPLKEEKVKGESVRSKTGVGKRESRMEKKARRDATDP